MSTPEHASMSAAVARRALWIRGPWTDLLFFVGVPLLLVPLILAAPGRPSVQELILVLGAFGALGHHLPGMMRAYGDRELFRRFRTRLILAPLFLTLVCVGFSVRGLTGIVLITFLWTTWHTSMQIYGFARIYDSKLGASSPWTTRLDLALCAAWILAPLCYSDARVAYALDLYYRTGGPLVGASTITALRTAWLAFTALASLALVARLAWTWARGARPNPVKLVFFAVSFGFWWFCMVAVEHLVAGIALFDVFHDVQYLALVWMFQRARVEKQAGVTGFTRFLFRSSGGLIGLYVGLIVAYGSIGHFSGKLASEDARNVITGVLAASALFHFYLDGFIWKVREPSTRESLGLAGGSSALATVARVRHAWKWSFFVIPLGVALYAESTRTLEQARWCEAVVAAAPESPEALTSHGVFLAAQGELERAVELHRRAIALAPSAPEPRNNLGVALRLQGKLQEARASFEDAVRLRPSYARAHGHLANLLLLLGQPGEAEIHYREALRLDARYADPRANLATLLIGRGERADAVTLLREALALEPENRGALNNLAWLLATSRDSGVRDPAEALQLAERLDSLTQHCLPQSLDTLAAALAASGRFDDASRAADAAIEQARTQQNEALARQIEARRETYRSKQSLLLP
jgi:Flp pilus assembly protein TadD